MPRAGGRRQGRAGTNYANRSDLRAPPLAPSQQYGQGVTHQAAVAAVPLPKQAPPSLPIPGMVADLTAPTARPAEPVTTGLPIGAGAGPQALGPGIGAPDEIGALLRAVYQRYPNEDVRRLIEQVDQA